MTYTTLLFTLLYMHTRRSYLTPSLAIALSLLLLSLGGYFLCRITLSSASYWLCLRGHIRVTSSAGAAVHSGALAMPLYSVRYFFFSEGRVGVCGYVLWRRHQNERERAGNIFLVVHFSPNTRTKESPLNPRPPAAEADKAVHHLLRRGISVGSPFHPLRGLLLVSQVYAQLTPSSITQRRRVGS